MKAILSFVTLAVCILLAACNRQTQTAAPTAPVSSPALTAWQAGDAATAVARFTETDWTNRPLFPADSPLSLTEAQFTKLTPAEAQAQSAQMTAQLDGLKKLAAAVAQAGRQAAGQGDAALARKHFTSLQQCGAALQSPDCLRLVQLVGKGIQKLAETELAKTTP